ncbi:MAG TPA: hypothetical protein GXX51_01565 [Firmicutes bacterium]|nr:hypothetical protein [Bacillota bacterium]
MRSAVAKVLVYNVADRAAGSYDADAEYARIEAEYNTIGPNREWLERSVEMERELLDARMGVKFDQN